MERGKRNHYCTIICTQGNNNCMNNSCIVTSCGMTNMLCQHLDMQHLTRIGISSFLIINFGHLTKLKEQYYKTLKVKTVLCPQFHTFFLSKWIKIHNIIEPLLNMCTMLYSRNIINSTPRVHKKISDYNHKIKVFISLVIDDLLHCSQILPDKCILPLG